MIDLLKLGSCWINLLKCVCGGGIIPSSYNGYQVFEVQSRVYSDLEKRQCLCAKWLKNNIQCKHMIPCVYHKRIELKDLCHAITLLKHFKRYKMRLYTHY